MWHIYRTRRAGGGRERRLDMAWGIIDRKEAKREARAILRGAQVSPMGILLLYMGIVWGLHQLRELLGVTGEAPTPRLEDREDGTAAPLT